MYRIPPSLDSQNNPITKCMFCDMYENLVNASCDLIDENNQREEANKDRLPAVLHHWMYLAIMLNDFSCDGQECEYPDD